MQGGSSDLVPDALGRHFALELGEGEQRFKCQAPVQTLRSTGKQDALEVTEFHGGSFPARRQRDAAPLHSAPIIRRPGFARARRPAMRSRRDAVRSVPA